VARLMVLQHPQSSDALRRLSIDTIGSSQRSSLGRLPPPRNTDWQLLLAQQQQSRAGGHLDPAAAVALDAAAQWRLQQQQALLGPSAALHVFGQSDSNNNALEMDLLYRTLLQQQQQQQQSDTLLNLSRQQQLIHDFTVQQQQQQQLHSGGNDGLEPNHLTSSHFDLPQQYRAAAAGGGLRPDPLDWSRNSNPTANHHLDAATLLALQQPPPLHFPHANHATTHFNNTSRMALEEQLAMMNALQQQQQQQNSLFFGASSAQQQQQQPHMASFSYGGGGANLGYAAGDGLDGGGHQDGAGSTSLLSALFAESQGPSLTPEGPAAFLGPTGARPTFPAAKKPKANAESAAQLPVRALSAYNFFFRDERDRIISSDDNEDVAENDPVHPDRLLRRRQAVPLDAAKKKQLLAGHWYRDRSVKRRHRKTHGKIAFTALSKVISQAWRDLPEVDKAFYRDVAAEDLERYQKEVEQLKFHDAVGRPSLPPAGGPHASDDLIEEPTAGTGV
jgi:HMG (high mobility group) box